MRRRRLLVLTSTYPRWEGDVEPGFVHELSKRMVDTFDVTVLGPHAAGAATRENLEGVEVVRYRYAPESMETLVNDGGIVTNLKRHRWKWLLVPGFLIAQMWVAWRLIRRSRPDVIHAHWLLPQGLIVALLRLVEWRMPPLVVTSHGADLFALRARPLQALKRYVAKRASALTVVSSPMRDVLVALGADPAKVSIEPMGVELQRRFVPDPAVARSRDEILFVGRLVEKKGLRYLIDAMPSVLESHPHARLTIAGFGPDEQACREQVRRLGLDRQVEFLGPVPQRELPELYRRAAVFVAPFVRASDGDQEGLGLVLVEAAGCGCPIIAGDVPAVRDVVRGADVGVLVAPGSVPALVDAISRTLSAPATADARTNRPESVLHFDWQQRAQAYASLLGAQAIE